MPLREPICRPTRPAVSAMADSRLQGAHMTAPVRRLIKPTTPRTVHLLNIGSLGSPVQAEASTEADFVRLAALCPAVKRVLAQPCTLQLSGGLYTPDFLIECHNGATSYWEVKLAARFDQYRSLFNDAAQLLALQGFRFYAVSNLSLRRHDRHRFAQLLQRYEKAQPSEGDIRRVLDAARSQPSGLCITELAELASVRSELVYHLLARRELTFKSRVSAHDLITLPELLEIRDDLLLASWLDVSPWRTNAGIGTGASRRKTCP